VMAPGCASFPPPLAAEFKDAFRGIALPIPGQQVMPGGGKNLFKGDGCSGRECFERRLKHRDEEGIAKVEIERLSEPFIKAARRARLLLGRRLCRGLPGNWRCSLEFW